MWVFRCCLIHRVLFHSKSYKGVVERNDYTVEFYFQDMAYWRQVCECNVCECNVHLYEMLHLWLGLPVLYSFRDSGKYLLFTKFAWKRLIICKMVPSSLQNGKSITTKEKRLCRFWLAFTYSKCSVKSFFSQHLHQNKSIFRNALLSVSNTTERY